CGESGSPFPPPRGAGRRSPPPPSPAAKRSQQGRAIPAASPSPLQRLPGESRRTGTPRPATRLPPEAGADSRRCIRSCGVGSGSKRPRPRLAPDPESRSLPAVCQGGRLRSTSLYSDSAAEGTVEAGSHRPSHHRLIGTEPVDDGEISTRGLNRLRRRHDPMVKPTILVESVNLDID